MPAIIQYGRCTNKLRCSLALNREAVFVPLDGRCPECGQPLEVGSMSRSRLKLVPLLLGIGLLAAGGYYLKTKFLDAPSAAAPGARTAAAGGRKVDRPDTGPLPANVTASDPDPQGGAVDKPTFNLEDEANAQARRDVLSRIEMMPNLTPGQKSKLTTSVDRARQMGCIFIIPFETGKKTLGPRETDILARGFQSAGIQRLMEDPTLVFVVLGYADKQGDAASSLKASVDRAQSVLTAMKERCGAQNVMYAVGMGGSKMFDARQAAKNRVVEIWAVFP